jgi:thymidylate kinase
MIIIEGPDAAGKSTFVDYIRKNSKVGLLKPFYPKQNQLSYYLHSPAQYTNFYLERYYISELVYPQFKPGRNKMQPWHQFLIEAGMMPFAPVIIYVRPAKETIIKNIKNRGDDYVNLDDIDQMLYYYDEVIDNSYFPVFTYDYEENHLETFLELIEGVHEERSQRALKLQKFLSSGNYYEEGSIIFIGDMPSKQSIGNGYLRAFISNTGSSEFLHRCLFDAGIYPTQQMPYFTNWNKCENNNYLNAKMLEEEIQLVKPRKIIFLGEEIGKKTWQKIGSVTYSTIYHPAFVKRFKTKNYDNYIKDLKLKCV